MPTIHINVSKKIATNPLREIIVCGNSDYTVEFAFDEEWNEHTHKTARFIYNGTFEDKVFSGNSVKVPIIRNALFVEIGVYAGDLHTTTAAIIETSKSILCKHGIPADPPPDVYAQIMDLLNSGEIPPLDVEGIPQPGADDVGAFLAATENGGVMWKHLPVYEGEYIVTPSPENAYTLKTAQKYMDADVCVKKIPYYETSNEQNGKTVYIGNEV